MTAGTPAEPTPDLPAPAPAPEPPAPGPPASGPPAGGAGPVRLRTSRSALLAAAVSAICATPVAAAVPALLVLYAAPVLAAAAVLRRGVDVDDRGITVRGLLGSRRIGWTEIARLRAGRRGELHLVLRSGSTVALPVLRARHLPLVAAASGGRIDPPAGPARP